MVYIQCFFFGGGQGGGVWAESCRLVGGGGGGGAVRCRVAGKGRGGGEGGEEKKEVRRLHLRDRPKAAARLRGGVLSGRVDRPPAGARRPLLLGSS